MKNIYAKSTSSIEAVIIAAIQFWLNEAGIDDLTIEETGMERDVTGFPAFSDRDVGRALCETRDYVTEFQQFADGNPYLKWVLRQFASGKPGLPSTFVSDQICTHLGKRMKASDWWVVNETTIKLESKKQKKAAA
jgi:hypothetical protein